MTFLRAPQCVAGDGRMAVVEGLEAPDEDEVIEVDRSAVRYTFHEAPSRLGGQRRVCPDA